MAERMQTPIARSTLQLLVRADCPSSTDQLSRGAVRPFAEFVGWRLMRTQPEGGCACGAVRYRMLSEPLIVHCCHCLNCQRHTGSAFVVNLLVEASRVETLAAAPQPVEVPRDDRRAQRIFRCPRCQVAVFSEYSRPGVWFVRGGTLDDPTRITPDVHIYTRSKVSWVTLPDGVPAFEAYYVPNQLWPAESLRRLEAISNQPQ
jgi:hypothetical protein